MRRPSPHRGASALLLACLGLVGCDPARPTLACPDAGCEAVSPYGWLADPSLPARRLPGRMHLASSREPGALDRWELNRDWSHFAGVDGEELVLLDERGPGLITRIWLTIKDDTHDFGAGDALPFHVYVDGAEVELEGSRRGTTLAELTSGRLEAFPRPWVAGRDLASNGFIVAAPIAFASSIRITLEDALPNMLVYYQIDWRELPAGTEVRSFDGTLTPSEADALARATALWVEGRGRGDASAREHLAIGPGESGAIAVEGPTVVHALRAELERARMPELAASLEVDGVTVIEAPLSRLLFAADPSMPHASALSAVGDASATFAYPIPVATRLTLSVRNDSTSALELDLSLSHAPDGFDPALGQLRLSCGAPAFETGFAPLLEVDGARGQYAGQFLVLRGAGSGWWMLEGDHRVEVDGEWAQLGTGTEDYIGGAFYFLAGPFTLPWSGASGYAFRDGREHLTSDRVDVSMYRHHLLDTIPFEDRMRFEYESYATGTVYEHCVVWYETPPG